MIILLEGPDGAGKSTLAAQLGSMLNLKTHHFSAFKGDLFKWYLTYLADLSTPIIIDRMWPSEQVYGPVFRGIDRLGSKTRMLERLLLSLEGVLVWCDPGLEACLTSFSSGREEMLDTKAQLEAVHAGYCQLKKTTSFPSVTYDYTITENLETLCDAILLQQPPANKGPGLGNFNTGNILVIGDQSTSLLEWPFISATGCSPWLCDQLELTKIPERQLYWVNALSYGIELDPHFIDKLKPSLVVALGQVAATWCKKHKLDHQAVPHPQAWKRFYSQDPYPLIEVLNGKS